MKDKTLNVLEYSKIIEMLKEQAGSEMTKKIISELKPVYDVREIREKQQETTEAVRLITAKGPLPVGGFYDIEGIAGFTRKGGVLTMAQLLKVLYNMKAAERTVTFMKGDDLPELPIIDAMVEIMAVHKSFAAELDRCIISEDEMADDASSELRSIRRAIVRQNDAVKAKMNHILNSERTILQDAWAEVEHELVYKSEFNPFDKPLRRKLASINASLTLADIVFQEIRDYQKKLQGEIAFRRNTFYEKADDITDEELGLEPKEKESLTAIDDDDLSITGTIDDLVLAALQAHNSGKLDKAVRIYTQIITSMVLV